MPAPIDSAQHSFFVVAAFFLVMLMFILAWRKTRGVTPLLFVVVSLVGWSLGMAFEITFASIEAKAVWAKLSQTSLIWLSVSWSVFLLELVFKDAPIRLRYLLMLAVVPLLITPLAWANDYHHLFWRSFSLAPACQCIKVTLGPAGWLGMVYDGSLAVLNLGLLAQMMRRISRQQNGQVVILLLCTLVIGFARFSPLLPIGSQTAINLTPLLFIILAILFIYGLMHYRILNIVPIPYQHIIGGMRDGILVLSLENRITHVNPVAETILMRTGREMIGKPVDKALAACPVLLEKLSGDQELLETIVLQTGPISAHYELHFNFLHDKFHRRIGKLVTLHNITKRIQAEAASQQNLLLLKQSEEKYRSLVENINEVIFTMTTDGTFTYVSPVIETHTGYSPEYLLGRSFFDFIHPEDSPALRINFTHALNGNLQTLEFRILDQNGHTRQVRAYCHPIIEGHQTVGLQGIVSDITETKQVEQALERRASQLAMLNDIGKQIAAVIELKNVMDSATRLIQTHFGYYHVAIFTPDYARGELLLRSTSGFFAELFPEDHHLKFGQGMVGWAAMNRTVLLANDVRLEPRYTNLYPDKILTRSELAVPILVGETMLGVLDIQSPLVNAFDENDVRVMETVADQIAIALENARLYEEVRLQLKERERKENMLRIHRDLLVRLSPARRLDEMLLLAIETLATELHANRAAIYLVDWDCQHVQPVVSLGYPDRQTQAGLPLNRSLPGWVACSAQPALIGDANADPRTQGLVEEAQALLCVPLVTESQVIGVVSLESEIAYAFTQDDLRLLTTLASSLVMLVERARLFEQIEQARAELESRATALEEANAGLRELDRLKSQFLANMSHELRTPLNSIIGFSEVLVDEISGPLNGEQKEFVHDILDSGLHLLTLINDLLDFSKIEAGRMALDRSTFEIKHLFEELRITIAPLIEKKSQVLVFRQDGNLPALTADHLRIKQVFLNLLSNANKFTPASGMITVSCRLVEDEQFLFAIQDTGIGIHKEDQELIFEEFRQVDGSMTREVAGSGLGLTISKRMIELHQGQIWVESEPGKGSTFFIRLPVGCMANSI